MDYQPRRAVRRRVVVLNSSFEFLALYLKPPTLLSGGFLFTFGAHIMFSLDKKQSHQAQRGFTLVEIAIVLVIIGLLIGGVLRGQELITSARVRNIVSQQTSVQAAYFGFLDRYKATPGDLTATQALLVNNNTQAAFMTPGDGVIQAFDSVSFFNNLSQAGFINCSVCMKTYAAYQLPDTTNSPSNAFAGALVTEGIFGGDTNGGTGNANDYLSAIATGEPVRLKVTTGNNVPSPIAAEADRKMDDGNPATGIFRASSLGINGVVNGQFNGFASMANCATLGVSPTRWVISPSAYCQGALLY
jgi:prepilin-type N-terminal cleavage/methylation domain-containing protein